MPKTLNALHAALAAQLPCPMFDQNQAMSSSMSSAFGKWR